MAGTEGNMELDPRDARNRTPRFAGRLRHAVIAAALFLCGCVSYAPTVPEGYAGPTVLLEDTWISDHGTRATFFVVTHIDGRSVQNSLVETRKASAGEGFTLHGRVVATRQVPVRPMRLRLVGTHMTAAPIHEVAARLMGTFQSVDGEVDFEPVETGVYRVTGSLSPEQSCVWVEEGWSRAAVTEKVWTPRGNS
jgi:hypothetical protein